MKVAWVAAGLALIASASSAQVSYQNYTAGTGLSAELPGEIERFDQWTDIAKGRVIQLTSTIEEKEEGQGWASFKAYYFVQAVIADQPYDVDAKLREMVAVSSDGAVSSDIISTRPLKPSEMPLDGMRGVEVVKRYQSFDADSSQIETSHDMFVGNKWLSVSVRHFQSDSRWSPQRLFKSVDWRP